MTPLERWWSHVDVGAPDECWPWTATVHRLGYGLCWSTNNPPKGARGAMRQAHRVGYELLVGPIPKGLVVRHKCDNPRCVNPAHLELGTQLDNMRDSRDRGRSPVGVRHPRALPAEKVEAIRQARASGRTTLDVAAEFEVSSSTVSRLSTGKRHRDSWERPGGHLGGLS